MNRVMMRLLIILALVSSGPLAAQTSETRRTWDTFADVRAEILNAIGGAQRRIWLATDFLSDGEIVSALYVAQYRKLEVQVLLGRAKSNAYMSRLNYLKTQNIPVWLKPGGFEPKVPTALLVDDLFLSVDGELDFLARGRKFTVVTENLGQKEQFLANFPTAVQRGIPAHARAVPLVGKARAASGQNHGTVSKGSVYRPDLGGNQTELGGYKYDRVREAPPRGVPTKLPKTTIWQEREKRSESEQAQEAAPAPQGDSPRDPKVGGAVSGGS
jgi:hypothetical protein